jgi:hypothetical protein
MAIAISAKVHAISQSVASTIEVAPILGVSKIAALMSGIFIVNAPPEIVIGSAIAAYAMERMMGNYTIKRNNVKISKKLGNSEIKNKIGNFKKESQRKNISEDKCCKLMGAMQLLMEQRKLTQEQSTKLIENVNTKSISYDVAFDTLQQMIK